MGFRRGLPEDAELEALNAELERRVEERTKKNWPMPKNYS
jgi:hypothetical protein